jgi:transcriptional regulator with XRE-family HTH domain
MPRAVPRTPPPIYLREWREYMHLSQGEIASLIGIHQVTISRWENWRRPHPDGRRPDLNAIAAFAEALKLHPSLLFHPPPGMDREQPVSFQGGNGRLPKFISDPY